MFIKDNGAAIYIITKNGITVRSSPYYILDYKRRHSGFIDIGDNYKNVFESIEEIKREYDN